MYLFISTATLTNLARQRCTLQSAPSMATLTLRRLALARCGRRGVASTPSSAASVPPSKRTEGSRKQTLLGLEQLGSIFVRFVICSQKQEGSAMRKRSGSAPANSCRSRSSSSFRPHQEVQVYEKLCYSPAAATLSYLEKVSKWVLPFFFFSLFIRLL